MHSLLLPLLILAASEQPPIAPQREEAFEIYRCDFEESFDRNYDNWPDDWTRRRGRGYPFYLPVEIASVSQQASSSRALKIELDGGAAVIYSPPVRIDPAYSYLLHVDLKTERLQSNVAYCSVSFLDAEFGTIETFSSAKVRPESWTKLEIGPITPKTSAVVWARIQLHLEPTRRPDLVGRAWFDNLWFGRLPRMSLKTEFNHPFSIFTQAEEVSIDCRVSGFSDDNPVVTFQLIGVDGEVLLTEERPIHELDSDQGFTPRPRSGSPAASLPVPSGFAGGASWAPRIPGNGFYRVRAFLPGNRGSIIERTINLVVVDPQPATKSGEFGWSLPRGDDPLEIRHLEKVLQQAGVHWVKFPVWYSDEDQGRADELARFAEMLNTHQMQLVGMLDRPPQNVRQMFGEKGKLPIASVFVDSNVWRPAVDPVMTRLSLKVRWWQLGSDRDTSFVNFPNLEEKVRSIRRDLNRFGQEINLGISLRSIDESPAAKDAPWSFLSHTAFPPLTSEELETYFPRDDPKAGKVARWLVLEPLSAQHYDLPTRASDLVQRMISAKKQSVEGVFIPDPFAADTGLMGPDGSPGPLLLAWRTTAIMISGSEYMGSIALPNGSQNHLFVRGDQAVMAVWNDHATEEAIYLGEEIEQFDLWGRSRKPTVVKNGDIKRQVIQVGTLPAFITGVDPKIARWRMAFEFETDRLASIFGQQQTIWYQFTNTFDHGVSGNVHLITSIVPETRFTEAKFKLAEGEQSRQPLKVTLAANVDSGPQAVRADFHVHPYHFSVHRTIQVGLGDVEFELDSRIDEFGNLVVDQTVTNKTDKFVSFNCLLFAKDRRRQRRQVVNLSRGSTTDRFVFPNGEDLVGTPLTLRAEEINGARVLNHHHTAKR